MPFAYFIIFSDVEPQWLYVDVRRFIVLRDSGFWAAQKSVRVRLYAILRCFYVISA